MKKSLVISAVLAATLVIPQIGFSQDKKHMDAFIPGNAGEARLVQEVRHQLVMLPYYSIFDDLGFRVEGGTVTLIGTATRPTLKSDAEGVTKRVEGVTSVVNQIEVLPLSPMDWDVRRDEARAIYGNGVIGDRYGNRSLPPIHIIVKNGNVTLEGVVANEFDKNFINVRANGVPNVFHVQNNLIVENSSAHKSDKKS
jgi:hyperosmotically inducible protein